MNLISETYLTKVLIFSASITLLAQSSFLFAQPVNVSEEKGFRPTLREAIDAAYQRHQQQLILKANARQVSAQQDRSRSLLPGPPSLDISVKSDQVGSDEGYREYEAGIELPLWRIGQRGTEQQLASISQSLLLQSEASLRLIVAGKVRELMWNASLLKNDEILAEKEKQTAETLEQNVSRRVELGELARTDLLLAQTHTLHKKSALVQAEADLRTALNDYHLITGYTQLPRQRFEQRSEAESLPLEHPLLRELDLLIQQARAEYETTLKSVGDNTNLFLGARRERGDANTEYNNAIALGLSVPFGRHTYSKPQIVSQDKVVAELQTQRQSLMQQLNSKFFAARQELAALDERLELEERLNSIAQENLRLANIAFSAGETDLVRLLQIQSAAFAAERNEKQLKIMRQRATSRFNQAAGVMP